MNACCHQYDIKNDFKSINIDNFIESFNQTYPQYLSIPHVKNEQFGQSGKAEIEQKEHRDTRRHSRRRRPSASE